MNAAPTISAPGAVDAPESTLPCAASPDGRCSHVLLGRFTGRKDPGDRVLVYRCKACGHAITWPPLPDVSALYEDRASQDFQPHNRGLTHAIKRVAFRSAMRRLLRQVGGQPRSVLDFGCGSGQFTRALGDLLPNAEVTGSDFHPDPPIELNGRPYLGLDALPERAGSFDLVIALHVLEHDDDPVALAKRIAAMSRPDGIVVFEVPDVDCVWARWAGRWWDGWYLPYHRHHFNRRSLVALAELAGLEIVAVHGITVPTSGRTLANLCGRPNSLPFLLAGIALHPLQLLGEVLTGPRSAVRLIARKRGAGSPG